MIFDIDIYLIHISYMYITVYNTYMYRHTHTLTPQYTPEQKEHFTEVPNSPRVPKVCNGVPCICLACCAWCVNSWLPVVGKPKNLGKQQQIRSTMATYEQHQKSVYQLNQHTCTIHFMRESLVYKPLASFRLHSKHFWSSLVWLSASLQWKVLALISK